MANSTFTSDEVKSVSSLANIPLTEKETIVLAKGFTQTMAVVDILGKIETNTIEPTHQVTGLENILRDDFIDEHRMLSQEEALSGAQRKHNGFFVVPRVLEQTIDP